LSPSTCLTRLALPTTQGPARLVPTMSRRFWSMILVGGFLCFVHTVSSLVAPFHRQHQPETVRTATKNLLTDWVIENLESSGNITSASTIQAGENDTLPTGGLSVGPFLILPAGAATTTDRSKHEIRLLLGRNGWGSGVHPSTRLCLEWLARSDITALLHNRVHVLDYGCGSGILSIAALHLGAKHCTGVDIEAEALVTATRNVELNFGSRVDNDDLPLFRGLHTREVEPFRIPHGPVDVVVANILIGQLVRPSMVAVLVSNVQPGGYLCFSGIRPAEVPSLQSVYDADVEWLTEHYAELEAQQTPGCLESYGFDCGAWARVVGRKKWRRDDGGGDSGDTNDFIARMSELAVS
jgi:ribosomal protein L11 methylase PrmA